MRFGIMAMQLSALIPQGLTAENGPALVAGFDHAAHVRRIAGAGFDTVELGGDLLLFFPHAYAPPAIERLAALKSELGLTYTVHLPLWSVEPSTPLAPVREGSVRAVVEVIRATAPLAPESYVLHATNALAAEFYRMRMPESLRPVVLSLFQRNARDSVRAILDATGIASRRLAIETVEFPFELTLALAEELDLSVCLDTGHVLAGFAGPVDLFDALERCLPRLGQVHLHDAPWQGPERHIGYGEDHRPLGAGDLDLPRFLDRLAVANFTGPVIMELTIEHALASLDVIRAARPAALDA